MHQPKKEVFAATIWKPGSNMEERYGLMNISDYVRKLLNRERPPESHEKAYQLNSAENEQNSSSPCGIASLEGMSTATARFVIERNVPADFADRWNVTDISNRGRYYIAKVVGPDGKLIDELLVDKQNGAVNFLKGRFVSG